MKSVAVLFALVCSALAADSSTVAPSSRVSSKAPMTAPMTGSVVTVTSTVYCPTSTTFICNGVTYPVSTATTITLTCPGKCSTSAVPTAPVAPPTPAAPTSSKPVYTGAAIAMQPQQVGGALAAAALGFLVL